MQTQLMIPGAPLAPYPPDLAIRHPDTAVDEFMHVLARRRRTLVWMTISGFAAAILISLLMTPKYESVSRLEINHKAIGSLGMEEELGTDDSIDSTLAMHTQLEVLKSDSLALRVAHDFALDRKPEYRPPWWAFWERSSDQDSKPFEASPLRRERVLKKFHSNLSVKLVPGTRLIEIRFRDRDRQLAADVNNAVVNAFLDQYYRTRYQANQQASEWLTGQLNALKAQLSDSEKHVLDFQHSAGVLGTDETHNILTNKLEDLNHKVSEAEASRILHGAIYKIAQSYDPDLILGLHAKTGFVADDPGGQGPALLQTLRTKQSALQEERAAALVKFGPAYPKIAQLDGELAEVQAQLQQEMSRTLSRAEAEYEASRVAEQNLQGEFERQKEEANRLNDSAVQYTVLKQEMESQRSLYDELSRKLLESGVISGMRASNLIVVDAALPPARTSTPSWPLNLGLGLVGGLLIGLTGAFFREGTDHRVSSPLEAEHLTGAASLGLIPDLRCRAVSGGVIVTRAKLAQPFVQTPTLSAPKSAMAEIFRTVGSCLLLSRKEGPPKTIMVTSPLPNDGKSTVAVNLAVVLAQRGTRVLLVDADMRKGSVHSFLNLRQSSGLSDLLSSNYMMTEAAVQRGVVMNLSIIASGKTPSFPAELLSSDRFQTLLMEWQQNYDFVVFDTPPILSVTDPILLAPQAQSIVLVTRHGRTTRSTLSRSVEVLQRINTHASGIVLNGVDVNSPAYQEYFGYDFGRAYSKYYPQKVLQG